MLSLVGMHGIVSSRTTCCLKEPRQTSPSLLCVPTTLVSTTVQHGTNWDLNPPLWLRSLSSVSSACVCDINLLLLLFVFNWILMALSIYPANWNSQLGMTSHPRWAFFQNGNKLVAASGKVFAEPLLLALWADSTHSADLRTQHSCPARHTNTKNTIK